jgi:hypothetical protein
MKKANKITQKKNHSNMRNSVEARKEKALDGKRPSVNRAKKTADSNRNS